MTVVVGVDGAGRTHRLRELAAAAPGPVRWVLPDAAAAAAADPSTDATLVVDDPHQLDEATLRTVAAAARAGVPVLLGRRPTIGSAALADLDAAVAATSRVEILRPLDNAAVARIVGDAHGRPSTPDETARVRDASAGLPAFVTALAAGEEGAILLRVQRRLAAFGEAAAAAARTLALDLALDDAALAAATGQQPDDLTTALRQLRDEGLLAPGGERLVPTVAAAVLAELTPAERRRLHDAVARALVATDADPVVAAGQLRAARARTAAAGRVYAAAAERLRLTDPAAARAWYDDAADAGADPATLAAGRAEADALLGLPFDPDVTSDDPDRHALVAAAVAAHDGRTARAADALRVAAPPGPLLAVPALVANGRLKEADEAAATAGPTSLRRLAEAALTAAINPPAAVPMFIEAAESLTRVRPALVLPDTPQALGALVAVTAGDAVTAEHLLRHAAAHGPVEAVRHRLLLAWTRMRTGRYDTAAALLRQLRGEPAPGGRERLLAAALAAGLARRSGDIARLREAWSGVEPVLARQAVDLFHAEPVEELAVAAARLRRPQRFAPVLDALDAAVAGLGRPPAWVGVVGWLRFQGALAADDAGAAAAAAEALAATPASTERQRAQAVAATLWARTLGGEVDPDAVATAVDALAAAGLPWEASRLAGHAAIRIGDASATRRLLEQARDLSSAEPATATESGAGGLSEREVEVARLVLDGRTHKEIGAQLYISPKTVEHHVARIRTKVGATDRAEFVAALRGLLANV